MPHLSGLNSSLTASAATPTLLDPDVVFSSLTNDFSGGSIVISGLGVGDELSLMNEGSGAGQVGFNQDTGVVSFEGTQIGSLSSSDGTVSIDLNASASATAVEEVLQALTISVDEDVATRTLNIQITDAQGRSLSSSDGLVQTSGEASPFNGIVVGNFSVPTFVDIDADGDLDAFVGNFSGTVDFLRNDGTVTTPDYVKASSSGNPLALVDVEMATPAFVDIDNDGDLDVFVGTRGGTVEFYRNDGTAADPSFVRVAGSQNPANGIDIGSYAAPQFADLDADGDMDLFIGNFEGQVRYFENQGTAEQADFVAVSGNANPFNGVDIGFVPKIDFVDYDGDGDQDAFLGEGYGPVFYYRNDGTDSEPDFTLVNAANAPLGGVDLTVDFAPAVADIDGDGDFDILAGNSSGSLSPSTRGLTFFEGISASTTTITIETARAEPIIGTNGADEITGTSNDDDINGGDGSDTLDGGDGDDTLFGGNQPDVLMGGNGKDILRGSNGADTLSGGTAFDDLSGGNGNDLLQGDGAGDRLRGDPGADTLDGGAGVTDQAYYFFSDAPVNVDLEAGTASGGYAEGDVLLNIESVVGSTGNDTLSGQSGGGRLAGAGGDDLLTGLGGRDRVEGGNGNDTLFGGAGDDQLIGGRGDDVLTGGVGDDTLRGNTGADTFVFGAGSGDDVIIGFRSDDTLDLSETTTDFTSLADVQAAATETGAGLLIDLGGGDTLLLQGVGLDDLVATSLSL